MMAAGVLLFDIVSTIQNRKYADVVKRSACLRRDLLVALAGATPALATGGRIQVAAQCAQPRRRCRERGCAPALGAARYLASCRANRSASMGSSAPASVAGLA